MIFIGVSSWIDLFNIVSLVESDGLKMAQTQPAQQAAHAHISYAQTEWTGPPVPGANGPAVMLGQPGAKTCGFLRLEREIPIRVSKW